MSVWTLDNIKKMVGRKCGDPEAAGYPNEIFDHLVEAIESLAEDIVTIADLDRALTEDERKQYAEVINISENEIYPMLFEFNKNPSYSNNVASFAITNANFVKVIKVRDLFINPQNVKNIRFERVFSMKEFTRRATNQHLRPRSAESVWINNGNKVLVLKYEDSSGISASIQLWFRCLISLDYSGWAENQNLQSLGFGTNFLVKAIDRAGYTMRMQLGLEKR